MRPSPIPAAAFDDVECVRQTLAGDRAAFGRIVAQYQSLVCSVAYNATGDLRRSEELAQETFIVAWRKLRDLREAAKLRSWLCGIVRHQAGMALRRQGREPTHGAEPLQRADAIPEPGPSPLEAAVTGEEAAILWRALERIPGLYREPLILFYRESESTERVAEILDLSPETARQRLSRGRKLLHEEIAAFVAGALRRTVPGAPFTAGVLSALPALGASAGLAAFAASAKAGGVDKTATTLSGGAALFGPIISLVGPYLSYRLTLAAAESEEERRFVNRFFRRIVIFIFASWAILVPVTVIGGEAMVRRHPWVLFALMNLTLLAMLALMQRTRALFEQRQPGFRAARAARVGTGSAPGPRRVLAFRSRASFLGLPLVNIRLTQDLAESQEPVRGWIAVGGTAVGGLFACGGMAVAPISVGGLAVGGLALGGCALGLVSGGGFAAGIWAFGGMAEGWQAAGGMAFGWRAAMAGLGWAHDFAVGGMVHARHTNDAAAVAFVQHQLFYRDPKFARTLLLWGPLVIWLPLFLVMAWAQRGSGRASSPKRS